MSKPLNKTYWTGAWIRFREPVKEFASCEQTTVYAHDGAQCRGLYWTPKSNPRPKVAVIAAHPRVDFTEHYAFPRLLKAGYACLGANLRSLKNDVNCIHEHLLLDMAAYMQWLRGEMGVEKVVWLGNSGGGSLGCFYQAQAKAAPAQRLHGTPAGRPVPLAEVSMPAFDAMMITAAHTGQGLIINETIDPSVLDENRPLLTDPSLDMYDPANGFRPAPAWSRYTPEFVERYRAAQLERVARLDAVARAMVQEKNDAEAMQSNEGFSTLPFTAQRAILHRASFQPLMTIYRTMANLHYVDNSIDPSNRGYGGLISSRPHLANYQLAGFARMQTPDAWLSTWSGLSSNANLLKNAPAVTEPVVVVHAGKDLDVYPNTHTQRIVDSLGSTDKTYLDFPNALHYFEPDEGEDPNTGAIAQMAKLLPWLQSRVPL